MKDQTQEEIWQDEPSAKYYTNIKPTCDYCGRTVDAVILYRVSEASKPVRACCVDEKTCCVKVMQDLFDANPTVDNLFVSQLNYKG